MKKNYIGYYFCDRTYFFKIDRVEHDFDIKKRDFECSLNKIKERTCSKEDFAEFLEDLGAVSFSQDELNQESEYSSWFFKFSVVIAIILIPLVVIDFTIGGIFSLIATVTMAATELFFGLFELLSLLKKDVVTKAFSEEGPGKSTTFEALSNKIVAKGASLEKAISPTGNPVVNPGSDEVAKPEGRGQNGTYPCDIKKNN